MIIQTVKFNVGGQHYQISKSLLDLYPDTILAKLTCEYWLMEQQHQHHQQKMYDNNVTNHSRLLEDDADDVDDDDDDDIVDENNTDGDENNTDDDENHIDDDCYNIEVVHNENNGSPPYEKNHHKNNGNNNHHRASNITIAPPATTATKYDDNNDGIFIDRDGYLFRHVLNYLRDGKVILPITIDKNAFLFELQYYGILDTISNNKNDNIMISTQASAQCVLQINGLITSLVKEESSIRFARLCIEQFKDRGSNCTSGIHSSGNSGNSNDHIGGSYKSGSYGEHNLELLNEFHFIVRSVDYGSGSGGGGGSNSSSSSGNGGVYGGVQGQRKKDESLYNAVDDVANGGDDMKDRSNVYLKKFGLWLKHIDGKDVFRQRTKYKVVLAVIAV